MAKALNRFQDLREQLKNIDAQYAVPSPLGDTVPRSKLRYLDAGEVRSLRNKLGLSQNKLAQWLGVSWVSVSRWERGKGRPASREALVLARLAELYASLEKHFTLEEIVRFFDEPHENLFSDRPIDVLATELGYRAVRNVLEGALTGAYS